MRTSFKKLTLFSEKEHPADLHQIAVLKNKIKNVNQSYFNVTKYSQAINSDATWFIVCNFSPFSIKLDGAGAPIGCDCIPLNIFKKLITSLATSMEQSILSALPKWISILFDRWTTLDAYYVSFFHIHASNSKSIYFDSFILNDVKGAKLEIPHHESSITHLSCLRFWTDRTENRNSKFKMTSWFYTSIPYGLGQWKPKTDWTEKWKS